MELDGALRYEMIKELGSGSFGSVYLARDKVTGQEVAIKFIERGPKVDKRVENEIVNHKSLHHCHVIRFREVFLLSEYLCIVMDYAPGGNLLQYLNQKICLSEDEARWYFQQLVLGLDYCHKMGVANRDIKLDNTLLEGNGPWHMLKICDFGFSKHEVMNSAPHSRVGTPDYLAPEVLLCKNGKHYDGKMADVWSCGVFLYKMITSQYPFSKHKSAKPMQTLIELVNRIINVEYSFPVDVAMSDDCKDLIQAIFCKDVSKRIDILSIIQHRWFKKNLPFGAEKLNTRLQKNTQGQSVEEIRNIIQIANAKEVIRSVDSSTMHNLMDHQNLGHESS